MTYYSINRILEIIKNYRVNMDNIAREDSDLSSVGVAQYGIEASMPKAQGGTSDVVYTEVSRLIEGTRFFAEMKTDMKYVQDRWDRVTNETDAHILKLRLDGLSAVEIGRILNRTDRMIHVRLRRIAETIKGY